MRDYYIGEEAYNYCEFDPLPRLNSRKCNRLKPFRAHHCSRCKVCILKMDHHCQYPLPLSLQCRWINNCVGARNQKYFILYLLYVHMGEVYACILGCCRIFILRSYFHVSILPCVNGLEVHRF